MHLTKPGPIVWFSIAGSVSYASGRREQIPVRVTRDQLQAWFHNLGLDVAFLPPPILKVDAFRKATTEAKRLYLLPDGREAELFVDEVDSNDEFVLRHVMRKVRDPRPPVDDDGRRAGNEQYKSRLSPASAVRTWTRSTHLPAWTPRTGSRLSRQLPQ